MTRASIEWRLKQLEPRHDARRIRGIIEVPDMCRPKQLCRDW